LEKRPVLFDQIGSQQVLVVFHQPTRTAVAWAPLLNNRKLEFDLSKNDKADVILMDRQTGSTWSGLTGRSTAGPAKASQLKQLTTTQFVVENWPLHYPDAPVYRGN